MHGETPSDEAISLSLSIERAGHLIREALIQSSSLFTTKLVSAQASCDAISKQLVSSRVQSPQTHIPNAKLNKLPCLDVAIG